MLYIAGWGRSGSTLLSEVLGSVPGLFAGGELAFLWNVLSEPGWLCGCGQGLRECPAWKSILQSMDGAGDPGFISRMQDSLRHMLDKRRHGHRVLHPPLREGAQESFGLQQLSAFYAGIARTTGSRVVVDSSKIPLYAAWLRQAPDLDVYFLHLIRDPRAVAYSWSRRKENMSGTGMGDLPQRSTLQSALRWIGVNQIFRAMGRQMRGRYLFMRYMDFLADPRGKMAEILNFIGEPDLPNPVAPDHHVHLQTTHLAFGNPGRFRHGDLVLKPRVEWRTDMPRRDRHLVTALCAPWMLRFGYPLRTPAPHER